MGHSHDHSHGDRSQYYKEQLLTILVCGAFGVVTVVLYASGTLNNMLAVKFHLWVLLGGAALLVMSAINAVAVWFSVGEAKAAPAHEHDHDHPHDHAHSNGHSHDHDHGDHHHHHDHAHCDHDHDHVHAHDHVHTHTHAETAVKTDVGAPIAAPSLQTDTPAVAPAHDHGHDGHDHGWAPWRYAVLLLPVAIYFVVPLDALSAAGAKPVEVDASAAPGVDKNEEDFSITFQQLELAALYPENRGFYEGKTVRLIGQYVPKDAHMFTLRRLKISCCVADGVPLNAVILLDPKSGKTLPSEQLQGKWVQVTGRVEFLPRTGGGFATTLVLAPTEKRPLTELVKEVPPPGNPYLN